MKSKSKGTKKNNTKNQGLTNEITLAIEYKAPKKHKKTTKEITRIPRPLGITLLSIEHYNNIDTISKKQIKNRLIDRYINIYLNQGYQMFGEPIAIETIAEHIGITYIDMFKRISRMWKVMGQGLGEPDGIKDTYNGLLASILQFGLSDRNRIMAQYHILNKDQGKGYVPFLSSAVNGTLKLLLESNKGMVDVLKALNPTGPGTINILNQNTNNDNSKTENRFTVNQAIGLLEQSPLTNLLGQERQNMLDQLASHYLTDDVPEINATLQESVHDKNLKSPISQKAKDNSHENHRANAEGIDEDYEIVE